MKHLKIFLLVTAIVLLILGSFILKTFRDAGEFKKIHAQFKGRCRAISGVLSSEDITIHQKSGLAFISSDDRRPLFAGKEGRQGAIYALDLNKQDAGLVLLTSRFSKEFHPHGIGLYEGRGGKLSLFVVNHRKAGHFVEIFDYSEGELIHRESVQGALMHSPNDVLPVGDRTFYVTNDHGYSSKIGRAAEEYLQLAKSYVLFYDGKVFRIVADDLTYANGINLSLDGKQVYVAATVGREIRVYDRERTSGDLRQRGGMHLGTGVDNIEVDVNGNLWIGAHPKLLTFVKYSKDPGVLSPSQVLRITLNPGGDPLVEEVYMGEGNALSGSSVAAVYGETMLVGSVFDERFLSCRLAPRVRE
jgi:arylesterase/paraoxonase